MKPAIAILFTVALTLGLETAAYDKPCQSGDCLDFGCNNTCPTACPQGGSSFGSGPNSSGVHSAGTGLCGGCVGSIGSLGSGQMLKFSADGRASGMPGWRVSEPHVTLWIDDQPLGYTPALGPEVAFQLSYSQRS